MLPFLILISQEFYGFRAMSIRLLIRLLDLVVSYVLLSVFFLSLL